MKTRLLFLALIIPALAILSYLVGDKLILVARIAQLYAAAPDQQLAMPVAGVSKNNVNDSWHAPRDGGARQHQGQDIFASRGTPVLSATDGYVVSVAENKLGGRTVSVVGAGGRVYYYAHLDQYAGDIGVGKRVTPETVLGYVGTTGNAVGTSPHLHFGVYSSSGTINPLPMLSDRPEVKTALAKDDIQRKGQR